MKYGGCLICCLVWGFYGSVPLSAQETSLIKPYAIPTLEGHDSLRFGVVLPPSYGENGRSFPVIYYMHGMNRYYLGPRARWIASFFQEQITKGQLPECILVFMDGGEGFWMNHADGDPELETGIVNYLIPYMDGNYRTDPARRLTMGYSLGGNGAVFFYMKHPELFAACASLDGGIVTYEDFLGRMGSRPGIISDKEYFLENGSPFGWVERNNEALKAKQDTCIFLSAAFLMEPNTYFHSLLEEAGIPSRFVLLDSANHEFNYVFSESKEALMEFLSEKLH